MATIRRMALRNKQQVAKRQVKQGNKAGHKIARAKPRAAAVGMKGKSESERPSRGGHQQAFF